jgi:muramidase (phage lysozyme)
MAAMDSFMQFLAALFAPQKAPQHPTLPPGTPPQSTQETAFLYVIRCCEGTAADDGYHYLFGSSPSNALRFIDMSTHPDIMKPYTDLSGKQIFTSAAGAYQITYPTYKEFGAGPFTPEAQDKMALAIIQRCGALADVDAGRLQLALNKCAGRWASLPAANVPQPHRTYDYCRAAFERAGGVVAP